MFGYHRLLSNLGESAAQEALGAAIREHFEYEEVALDQLDPAGEEGVGVFGYLDAHLRQGFRLRLKDPAALEAAIPGTSRAFRELDAAILEALILRDALGMTAEDIEAKRGIAYTASAERALASLDEGTHAAFLDACLDARPAGARRRRGRRDHAPEVDVLLPACSRESS